ncbi:MAG: FAD-binding oxidoreductase [Chloroflexota bacterium]
MNGSSADVVVVGGGIVGTAAAAFLAEGGARVVLVEREGLASGASGANSGVVQHPFDPVLGDLYRETLVLYRKLSAGGATFRFPAEPAGMLFVSTHEAAVRRLARSIGDAFPDLRTEVVAGVALEELEPALAPGLWACRVEMGYPVLPAASTYAYATLAESRGVEVRLGREAVLAVDGDRVTGVRVDNRLLPAGAVLVAAGPGTSSLIDPTGRWTPIRPLWGVVVETDLAVTPRHVLEGADIDAAIGTPSADAESHDEAGPGVEFSLVPLPGGSAVGSTFLDREPHPAAWMEPILVRASGFVPGVLDAPIRGVRACARPQSVDGRPLVGRVPWLRQLWVCAGHGPWGISTGPASARLVADLLLGRDPAIPADLDPARFGVPGGSAWQVGTPDGGSGGPSRLPPGGDDHASTATAAPMAADS